MTILSVACVSCCRQCFSDVVRSALVGFRFKLNGETTKAILLYKILPKTERQGIATSLLIIKFVVPHHHHSSCTAP